MTTSEQIDHTRPGEKWEFNRDVAHVFDNMLRRSIPQYDSMRDACFSMAEHYIQPGTDVLDLGCSRGEALAPLVERFGETNRFIGVEVSKPMLEVCRERFADKADRVKIIDMDLRNAYPACSPSVTMAILTIQFIPIEHRQRVIQEAFDHTVPGGVMIFVEKILGRSAHLNEKMVHLYYDLKTRNGYTLEDIERKRLSLEGVLVPVTADWNEDMLVTSGFSRVECFWRWMNFAGWIAVKS